MTEPLVFQDSVYTPDELAAMWSVPKGAVLHAIQSGDIRAFWLGPRTPRVPRTAITDEAREKCLSAPSECLKKTRARMPGSRHGGRLSLGARMRQVASAHAGGLDRVYFIRCGRYVKVGYSQDCESRLSALRTTTPHDVDLLGTLTGGREAERAIHQLLARLRHRHEWFRLSPGLKKAIVEACND